MGGGSGSGNGSATSTMGGASPTTGTSPPITSFTGAAATTQKMISAAAIVAGLAAFAL